MPRRILLLVTDLAIGGTPTVVRELATRLHDPPAVEVEVACLKSWGPVADQLRDAGITVTAFGARSARELPSVVRRLRERVRERRIDTVFSFLIHANVVAARASKKLPGVRFLQSIQTIQPRPRWHWWAQRWAHRHAERIVVPSTVIVKVAGSRSRIPASKFDVIPNAIDPGAFERVEVFRGPVIRAGYLGRLDPAKNPAVLLDALRSSAIDDAQLHYYGEGPARAQLEQLAARQEFKNRVFLHGAVPRPQDALKNIDVLWQPSSVEGFGLVVLEAMASGIPVVATGAGGEADIITDGENGLIDATLRFALSLRRLRDDPALRQRLIENGLRTVRERFTWQVVLPHYRRLLNLPQS